MEPAGSDRAPIVAVRSLLARPPDGKGFVKLCADVEPRIPARRHMKTDGAASRLSIRPSLTNGGLGRPPLNRPWTLAVAMIVDRLCAEPGDCCAIARVVPLCDPRPWPAESVPATSSSRRE